MADTSSISSYQAQYYTLQQQDAAELLYASFLSPQAGLANADAVLGQAAQLLGTPGASTAAGATTGTSTTATDPLDALPSVSSILAASDTEAQQTLTAYGNAPAGSSIIDYQA
jgi:hypothetical protein